MSLEIPITAAVVAHLTFEEFELLPDQPGKLELLRGELIDLPPAKRKHSEAAHRIYRDLARILQSPQAILPELGTPFLEMGYRFTGHTWLQPDVSTSHKGQGGDDYFLGSPALAVEVVSERNTADQIDGKVAEYLAGGGLEVWVLYPKKEHMWVYRPDGTAEMFSAEFQSPLLCGATLNVAGFLSENPA